MVFVKFPTEVRTGPCMLVVHREGGNIVEFTCPDGKSRIVLGHYTEQARLPKLVHHENAPRIIRCAGGG